MNAQEIRIGNFAFLNDVGIVTIESINSKQNHKYRLIGVALNGKIIGRYRENVIMPIELDYFWLTKLGFKIKESHKTYSHDSGVYFELHKPNEGSHNYRAGKYISGEFYQIGEPIMHVHKLQNVYYELENKELIPKL